ncbi:transcription cofactor vestigial-like protein 3 isoform X4 [Manacus candei]|uniref:transcription cofactor vestigial-like protein 3 isoform X4 n=1 Tax=Manacus candei TaxID=415023 RepID=UPI0022275BF5|nr:transcription cofactor vestigial-like protein 3 isoform X4 [Manacus candei]
MSCSDVAMQQPAPAACGTPRYLAAPAAGCAQKKLAVYNKMQESLEVTLPSKQEEDEKDQPAEMEYLNSRCVLFTYFQGDIGSVVDEHFSRALSQASSFNSETALTKSKTGLSPLWRESSAISSQRSSFPTSFWTSSYQPPPPPCLSGVHPDFPVTAPGTFPTADPGSWPGHGLHQTAPPPPPAASESWHYPLASQLAPRPPVRVPADAVGPRSQDSCSPVRRDKDRPRCCHQRYLSMGWSLSRNSGHCAEFWVRCRSTTSGQGQGDCLVLKCREIKTS